MVRKRIDLRKRPSAAASLRERLHSQRQAIKHTATIGWLADKYLHTTVKIPRAIMLSHEFVIADSDTARTRSTCLGSINIINIVSADDKRPHNVVYKISECYISYRLSHCESRPGDVDNSQRKVTTCDIWNPTTGKTTTTNDFSGFFRIRTSTWYGDCR